jgi:hypothetical protein
MMTHEEPATKVENCTGCLRENGFSSQEGHLLIFIYRTAKTTEDEDAK